METTGINKYEARRAGKSAWNKKARANTKTEWSNMIHTNDQLRAENEQLRAANAAFISRLQEAETSINSFRMLPKVPAIPFTPRKPWATGTPQCPVTYEGLPDLVQRTISDEHLNISALLSAYAGDGKKALPKEGTTVSKKIDITTGTRNEERAENFGKALQQLLGVSTTEIETSVNCAKLLHVNTAGAFGVNCLHNHTKEHGHMQGVLNLLLSGTKTWHMRPPGPRGSSTCITTIIQEAGQLLWLPPGWYHEVKTTGYGPELPRPRDLPRDCINSGPEIRIAHAFTVWCLPEELCEYALCSYACGASEEGQKPGTSMSTPAERTALYTLLAHAFTAEREDRSGKGSIR